jgi:type IV secretion system protein VirD4
MSGNTIGDVASWVDRQEERAVEEALGAVDGDVRDADDAAACRAALDTLRSVWSADERLRSSLGATAAAALDAYGDPSVIDCSRHADLTAGWLLDGGANTAYLCATADEQERLAPLFVTLLSEIRAAVYDRAAARGRPLDAPLLLVLDEAANIAPLPDLDTIASTDAGQGIQLVTVVQDLEQMERHYPGRAGTVVNNHRAKIVGSGISDGRTLDYFARMLGDEEIRQIDRPPRPTR